MAVKKSKNRLDYSKIKNIKNCKNVIYKIKNNVNNKVYIGQTISKLYKRIQRHCTDSNDENYVSFISTAIKKHKWENFDVEIVSFCKDQEDLDEKEKYWISFYKSNQKEYGYNLTSGGKDNYTIKHNIDIIRDKNKPRKKAVFSKEYLEQKSNDMKGENHMHWINVDKEKLTKYIKEKRSLLEISNIFNTSKQLILSRIKLFFNVNGLRQASKLLNLNINDKIIKSSDGKTTYLESDKLKLENLVKNGLTLVELAKELNCCKVLVTRKIKLFFGVKNLTELQERYNVNTINDFKRSFKKEIDLNKLKEIILKNYNLLQIASYFNVSSDTILRYIKYYFKSRGIKSVKEKFKLEAAD